MISAISVKDRLKNQAKEDEYMEKAFERLLLFEQIVLEEKVTRR